MLQNRSVAALSVAFLALLKERLPLKCLKGRLAVIAPPLEHSQLQTVASGIYCYFLKITLKFNLMLLFKS